MAAGRADLVLGSPLGRQFVAGRVVSIFELFDRLGLGSVPGTASLTRRGKPLRLRRAQRGWQDVTHQEARAVIGTCVAQWREAVPQEEVALLVDLAGHTWNFGFSGWDEALWGLTALAGPELRPVAEAILGSPAARRWWNPVDLAGQRYVEWAGRPRLTGRDLATR